MTNAIHRLCTVAKEACSTFARQSRLCDVACVPAWRSAQYARAERAPSSSGSRTLHASSRQLENFSDVNPGYIE